MTNAIPKLTPAQWLLSALAVGQGAALVYAGAVLDGHAPGDVYFILSIIRAVPGGIGASFAAAYATHNMTRTMGKKAQLAGAWSVGALIACSVIVTTICTVAPPTDWLRWFAAGSYAVMIDAAVVAVAVTSGKLFAEPVTVTKPTASAPQEGATPIKPTVVPKKTAVTYRSKKEQAAVEIPAFILANDREPSLDEVGAMLSVKASQASQYMKPYRTVKK